MSEQLAARSLLPAVTLWVAGLPKPKGSFRAFRFGARAVVTNDNPNTRAWEALVSEAAALKMGVVAPLEGPLDVAIRFDLPRPIGHFGSGKNAGELKRTAPHFPAVKPDIDKLLRATLDAMTGIVFVDDARVVRVTVEKVYATAPGAMIVVRLAGAPA